MAGLVSSANASGLSCCALLLSSSLAPLVAQLNSASYNAVQQSYWSLQESSLTPSCIVSPQSSADVAQVVKLLAGKKAANGQECSFAVKGRTHAPAAGFANIQNGVTVDMTSLSSLALSSDRSTLHVGAGANWLQVYDYLNGTGLAVAGGRNGQVGVGGLTTGGGISHFTTRVGFACDNVDNFEVVLASGQVVDANANQNPDLFRALKGGANNFGIVTRFDLETFPQGELSVTSLTNDVSQRNALFKAFTDITNARPFDENASLVMSALYNATARSWVFSTSAVNTAPDVPSSTFNELEAVPNIGNSTKIEWLANYANEPATPPLNWLFWTGTYSTSASLMSGIFDKVNDTIYDFNVAQGVVWSITFEPLPTLIIERSQQRGPNSLGLSPADGNEWILLISALWPDSSANSAVENAARQAGNMIDDYARSQGMLQRYRYINYADSSQRPIQSYGADSYANLVATSKKYDPSGLFQLQVPGGFKLY